MKRMIWEFPVYYYPSKIEKMAGGYRLIISVSQSRPEGKEFHDYYKSRDEQKADRMTWWFQHWVAEYASAA